MKLTAILTSLLLTATAVWGQNPTPPKIKIKNLNSPFNYPIPEQPNFEIVKKPSGAPQQITPADVEKCQVFKAQSLSGAYFEPAAIDLLLKSPGKLLILTECYQKIENIRKFGADEKSLLKANPDPKGRTQFVYEESKGVGNQCNIIRIWGVGEKPYSENIQRAHASMIKAINRLAQ